MNNIVNMAEKIANNVGEINESPTLAEVVDLFTKGALTRLYIVAQCADGMINEYEFNGQPQEASPLVA